MKRTAIAVAAFMLCVAATQWAMRGRHEPTGNAGYLGTELAGVEGVAAADSPTISGVRGVHTQWASSGYLGHVEGGVFGTGSTGVTGHGVLNGVVGVSFHSSGGVGVFGEGHVGVEGLSTNNFGVRGVTLHGTGLYGTINEGGTGHAGYFQGRVHVAGTLSKSAGSFKIDHPLDPAGRFLSHSFVESPDMKNFYDGVVTLGEDGSAVVELPSWFEALNRDFRYQLTTIGEHAPVYIAAEIAENRFRIAGGYAGMKVSWLVTGTRHDPYAEAHRIVVDEPKPPREVGRFLHPELYGFTAAQRIK